MQPLNFVYWLQGFMELQNPYYLDEGQIKIIRDHINLVLTNVTEDVESHNEIVSRDPEIDKLFELEVKYPNKVAYC